MESIYIFSGGTLKRKDNSLVLETENGRKHVPIENVGDIKVFGEVNMNKRFLEFMTKKRIIVHFFNREGYYVGSYYPREYLNSGLIILKQAEYFMDKSKRLELAKSFAMGGINSMLSVLKYYSRRGVKIDERIRLIEELKSKINDQNSIDSIMGIEGNCREVYYSAFNSIVKSEDFKIKRREKRPPTNYMNTLISFGNSLMYTTVLSEVYKTHLDPRIGFLHETNFRRFSLNLDVAEVFKPIIVDRVIFALVNKGEIKKSDFSRVTEGLKLSDKGKRKFIEKFEEKLKTTIEHPKLKRKVSYRTIIRMELHKLEKHILGDEKYIPFGVRW
ncbi:MAG: subtype I-B CRISPR-associated endonuclease Cas1 [Thermotoga sp.]|nr:MAG: subtype I-B CRISPR-associated endonuclease Cas1 [Thermotoga sp.]HDM70272.1 type I-B CRISPR-associated endonuclease Cas1 [Thermotogales bacterium]